MSMDRKIKIMGIGGGGGNVVGKIKDKLTFTDCIAVDSDKMSLSSRKFKTLQLAEKIANGLGCGGDDYFGAECAGESENEIRQELADTDILFIISCMGGGLGSGATPVIAEYAKSLKIKTYVIAILPLEFEGPKRQKTADKAVEKLETLCDDTTIELAVFNTQEYFSQWKNSFSEFFSYIEDRVFEAINETLKK